MFNHKRKHPSYVFGEKDSYYKFIGITHARKTKGLSNIPLPENPEISKTDKSYIRPYPLIDPKKVFSPIKFKYIVGKKNRYWFNKVKKKETYHK